MLRMISDTISNLSVYLFVFSLVYVIRAFFLIVLDIKLNGNNKIKLSGSELIVSWLTITYIITYLIIKFKG